MNETTRYRLTLPEDSKEVVLARQAETMQELAAAVSQGYIVSISLLDSYEYVRSTSSTVLANCTHSFWIFFKA